MTLAINGVRLDDPQRCYIIAEAAGSHNQDYVTAEALVRVAAEVGADAVKFQLITPELICADIPIPQGMDAQHDAWLRKLGVTQMRELFSKGGLPREWCKPLKALAESLGIAWLCTPFSLEEARFLVEDVGVGALKIASGDLTFTPLLRYVAQQPIPTLLSTGGATIHEVQVALDVLYDAGNAEWPGVAVFHCVSSYPCAEQEANIRAIESLREHMSCWPIGWSDHTLSNDLVPALAVAMGCTVIEKHLRLNNDYESVDSAHSLAPKAFQRMVKIVRSVPVILGSGLKEPQQSELHDKVWARRDPSDWLRPTAAARQGAWQ